MENFTYFLLEKVGPWEDEENENPFITTKNEKFPYKIASNNKKCFKKLQNTISTLKTPSNRNSTKILSISKDFIKYSNEESKIKKNFLLTRKKEHSNNFEDITTKLQPIGKEIQLIEISNKKAISLTPKQKLLNTIANKPKKINEKKELLDRTINNKSSKYFTPMIKPSKDASNKSIGNFLGKKLISMDTQSSDDIYVKGLGIKIDINSKTNKDSKILVHRKKYVFPRKISCSDFNQKNHNFKEEATKIKNDQLRKIEKKSMHFLKFFLLKYDQDELKKKKSMNIHKISLHT